MASAQKVEIFLEHRLKKAAGAGKHNFLSLVCDVLRAGGMEPVLRPMRERYEGAGLTLIHMKAPASLRGLVFRKVYRAPFWQIEQTDQRWEWDVARARFDPAQVDQETAQKFRNFWRRKMFPDVKVEAGDSIYVPLQGKLTTHRSFQSASPIEMLHKVLEATDRPVIATLHPNEDYSKAELEALDHAQRKFTNLTVDTGNMERHLPACHCVVTQNSSAAFQGYFLNKPAILFARIDFHHIAQIAGSAPLAEQIETSDHSVAFAEYVRWFWQDQSINAGKEEAREKIRARLLRFGWPLADA